MVRPEGVEPPTYWFVASCSIQLSYGRTLRWMQPSKNTGVSGLRQPLEERILRRFTCAETPGSAQNSQTQSCDRAQQLKHRIRSEDPVADVASA
jgi:hypothetical protein